MGIPWHIDCWLLTGLPSRRKQILRRLQNEANRCEFSHVYFADIDGCSNFERYYPQISIFITNSQIHKCKHIYSHLNKSLGNVYQKIRSLQLPTSAMVASGQILWDQDDQKPLDPILPGKKPFFNRHLLTNWFEKGICYGYGSNDMVKIYM